MEGSSEAPFPNRLGPRELQHPTQREASRESDSLGYTKIGLNRKVYSAHRLAWFWHYGCWPEQLDHVNRNRSDNRLENLREASESENQANVGLRANNTSGFRGVTQKKGKWRACICIRGVRAEFSGFDTPEEASAAYEEAHRKAFGHFSAPI